MTKPLRVLYVYKWATMGGVERVLLNRALALKDAQLAVEQDLYFFHDSGGLDAIKHYIEMYDLKQYLRVVERVNESLYDVILPIDTPEIFELVKDHSKIYMECHTAYKDNREYFKKLPPELKGIIVPSEHFKQDILDEVPDVLKEKVFVLGNFIPDQSVQHVTDPVMRFVKTPLIYVGRIDEFKNAAEVIDIFWNMQKKYGDQFMLILAGPVSPDVPLKKIITDNKMTNRFMYLPPLPFHKISSLLKMVKENKGIFMSASKGESFGLSAAEAIAHEIPVMLSHSHHSLVQGENAFLYEQGDVLQAVDKTYALIQHYEEMVEKTRPIYDLYRPNVFIQHWNTIFHS